MKYEIVYTKFLFRPPSKENSSLLIYMLGIRFVCFQFFIHTFIHSHLIRTLYIIIMRH